MFNFIIFCIFFLLFLAVYYLIRKIYKLKYLEKVKNKLLRVGISVLCLVPIVLLFNFVNVIVIYIHLIIFVGLVDLVFYFINKNIPKKKKVFSYENKFFLSVGLTTIYLCIAAFLAYNVWETKYEVYTNKDINGGRFRVAQISDSHVGTTFDGKGLQKYIDRINKTNPDIVVITGDFVDDDTTREEMIDACNSLGTLKTKYGVYFVYGNHDNGYYNYRNFKGSDLVNELNKNKVTVLLDQVQEINNNIYVIGREDKSQPRKEISELVKDLDKNKYMIDLNHQPNDYDNESKAKVDLVLSGHTHGGQLFPLGYVGLIIKANDALYGMKKIDNTTFIVNSGISGWEITFKTGTKSEYTVIDIIQK